MHYAAGFPTYVEDLLILILCLFTPFINARSNLLHLVCVRWVILRVPFFFLMTKALNLYRKTNVFLICLS